MGKRYKIAPEVRTDIICRIKEEGISVAQAAKEHGISDAAIYGWLGKGTKGSPSGFQKTVQFVTGARGRSRTGTTLRSVDFESTTSTNSVTRACWNFSLFFIFFQI